MTFSQIPLSSSYAVVTHWFGEAHTRVFHMTNVQGREPCLGNFMNNNSNNNNKINKQAINSR